MTAPHEAVVIDPESLYPNTDLSDLHLESEFDPSGRLPEPE